MSGDVLSCYSSGRVTSVSWVEARETIMHPVIHTTAPTTRNNLTLTVRAAAAAAAKSLQSCPTQVYSPIKNLKKIKGLKKNQ